MSTKAFALIELIVVIMIIGILAVVAMQLGVQLQNEAMKKSDDSVMAALKSAAAMAHMKNVIDGSDTWPGAGMVNFDVFSLLENSPPYNQYNSSDPITGRWQYGSRIVNASGLWYFPLYCPHYKQGAPGRLYRYAAAGGTFDPIEGYHPAGDVWVANGAKDNA